MELQYRCRQENRRQAVEARDSLNGIDYLEVLDREISDGSIPRQRTLLVYCFKAVDGNCFEDDRSRASSFTSRHVKIEGGMRVKGIKVLWAMRASEIGSALIISPEEKQAFEELFKKRNIIDRDHVLVIRTDTEGDFSTYRLSLLKFPADSDLPNAPPDNFDPLLSSVNFSFKVECPSEFDCRSVTSCPSEPRTEPIIDYLSKDYGSFRRLMLERLSAIAPDWRERNPADLGIALVEVLAYAADHLSYYQDAVATEAYLGTARQRVSLRRHARLLDYPMHEGCNARVWVALQVRSNANGNGIVLPGPSPDKPGTMLLTQVNAPRGVLAPQDLLLPQEVQVFETLHDLELYEAHNQIEFYTWGDERCCLPRGATRATLKDSSANPLRLRVGDVLIFEERFSPEAGLPANPSHRHSVRLTYVNPEAQMTDGDGKRQPAAAPLQDPLTGQDYVEIAWHPQDALPFPLCLSTQINGKLQEVSFAWGNVVLADAGMTIAGKDLEPPAVPESGRYRPRLPSRQLTYRVPHDDVLARQQPAQKSREQDPRQALPAISLTGEGERWTARRDLLESDRFAPEFVVEVGEGGRTYLRFGDGVFGKRPTNGLKATYRTGNGVMGNVGAEQIAHVVTAETGIFDVRNPLPAGGGTNPESIEQVRFQAPQAFRTQERAVTEADYVSAAQRHPEVQKAAATRRWTGSWPTLFLTIDRWGGQPVDGDFKEELRRFLERYRLAGHDLEIDGPRFVSLDIAMTVCVEPGYFRSQVKKALLETFSAGDLPDGRRGFFHPDRYSFGQPLYLSQLVAAAMEVAGVRWVDLDDTPPKPNRFRRWGQLPNQELAAGKISCDRLEILRLDNDPNAPENGKIEFYLEGGR